LVGLFLGGAALLGAACEDSSSPGGGGGFDGGATFDAPSAVTDTGSPMADGAIPDASGDGALEPLGPVACGAPQNLAGLPGGNATPSGLRAASLPGGRMIVMWGEQATVGQLTPAYRLFDGNAWGAPVLFAHVGTSAELAVDGLGNVYVAYEVTSLSKISRNVLPAGATAFNAEDLVDYDISSAPAFRCSALASGALLTYRTATAYTSSRYDVGSSSWGAPATIATLSGAYDGRTASGTAATTKAAAAWLDPSGLHVSTYDGATWAAPALDPNAPVFATATKPTPAVFANGDPYVVWQEFGFTTKIRGHRYHVATQSWDPPEAIYDGPPPGNLLVEARVDAADRLTVAFQGQLPTKPVGAIVARNVGAGWSSTELDGLFSNPTLDRFGNVYVMTSSISSSAGLLNRVGAADTTWLPVTTTGITTNADPFEQMAVTFDLANRVNVFAISGGSLKVVVCK
jgi:hypothetical protein